MLSWKEPSQPVSMFRVQFRDHLSGVEIVFVSAVAALEKQLQLGSQVGDAVDRFEDRLLPRHTE